MTDDIDMRTTRTPSQQGAGFLATSLYPPCTPRFSPTKRITPELLRRDLTIVHGEHVCGPSMRIIPRSHSAGKTSEHKLIFYRDPQEQRRTAVETGNLFWADETLRPTFDDLAFSDWGLQPIWLHDIAHGTFRGETNFRFYSISSMAWLFELSLSGKAVVDLGSREGITLLTALGNQAACAVGVELNPKKVLEANKNAELNPRLSENMHTIEGDILKPDTYIDALCEALGETREVAILCNIGYWPEYQPATNLTSFRTIELLQERGFLVHNLIFGGYNIESLRSRPERDEKAIHQKGFHRTPFHAEAGESLAVHYQA